MLNRRLKTVRIPKNINVINNRQVKRPLKPPILFIECVVCLERFLRVKASVGTFNQVRVLVVAFSEYCKNLS